MKNKEVSKKLMPYSIQFFAEKGDKPEDDTNETNEDNPDGSGNDSDKPKTFTQEQVNAMMSREKKEGKKAALAALGFKNEADAKKVLAVINAMNDNQEDDKDKDDKAKKTATDDVEKRIQMAENKASCFIAGVSKDSISDVIAIAMPKVTNEKSFESVLEDMKKNPKYAGFFGQEERQKGGTGNDPGTGNGRSNNDNKRDPAKAKELRKPKKAFFGGA